jgi:hypothetical protein
MQTFDTLSQLFSPTPIGPPDIAPLIPPPAVKPAVVMVKPRINPQGKNPAEAGDAGPPASSVYGSEPLSGGGIKSVPRLGPVAASTREASDAGKKKLFDNSGYWQDVAAGIQSVPGNAGPISAFANGFAGAISGGAKRKKDEKATEAATKQQAFENSLKSNAEGRANDASARDDKRLAIEQETAAEKRLLDKDGNLTAAGIGQIEKYADDYATSLGLKGSTLIGDERTAAEAKLEAYRKDAGSPHYRHRQAAHPAGQAGRHGRGDRRRRAAAAGNDAHHGSRHGSHAHPRRQPRPVPLQRRSRRPPSRAPPHRASSD